MNRVFNFAAGPSTLPVPVLEQLRDQMVEFGNTGMSLIEASHRGKAYDDVHQAAIANLTEIMSIPDNYQVMFLGGGATLQFAMVPMNLLARTKDLDLVNSGAWAKKALSDAKKLGNPRVIWDGSEGNFMSLPDPGTLKVNPDAAYMHITVNETIGGIEWQTFPETGNVPLVADMSSDIMSRKVPIEKFGLIYAGAQKNLAPAGVTLVIIRKDLLENCAEGLPAYLSYKVHAKENSLYNTPPVFSIWALKLVTDWVKSIGGIDAVANLASLRAKALYEAIDGSQGYYRSPVDPKFRSKMNIVWRLPTEDLEKAFIAEASKAGFSGLKGHRSVGGCRASVYNAMPVEGAEKLAQFMVDFQKRNG